MNATDASTLIGRSALELVALVQSHDASAEEVVRAHLDWIAAHNEHVGAFRIVRREQALAEARALSALSNLDTLPLAGVPVAIKDNIAVCGESVRAGSAALPDQPAALDHPVVQRLRAAGAVVVGITSTPELCIWASSDGAFGTARSPWNPALTAGGSSGGSAAAIASAMVPIAHGSDGLGSIRIPAAACGVFGLKPGAGVVPAGLGESAWFGLAENGPISTTVDDAALMLSVIADRPEFRDVTEPGTPLRIAVSVRSPALGVTVDPEYAAAARAAARVLADAGHRVTEANPPYPLRYATSILAHWFAGPVADAEALDTNRLEARTRTHLKMGRLALRFGLVRAEDRREWRRQQEQFFTHFDILLAPTLAAPPIAAESWSQRSWLANVLANMRYAPFTAPWNFAGFPAAAVPFGRHTSGLPLSIQVIATTGHEARLLRLCRQLETLAPWHRIAPAFMPPMAP
jgi:amidase